MLPGAAEGPGQLPPELPPNHRGSTAMSWDDVGYAFAEASMKWA
jgi:hypothetical protein